MNGTASIPRQTPRHVTALVMIVLATLAVYANSFQAPFELDDHRHIFDNHEIRNPANFLGFDKLLHRRTMVKLTFALNYRVHGTDVFGYHLVNTGIHIINGWLVYALVLAILAATGQSTEAKRYLVAGQPADTRPTTGGRAHMLALFSALVFVTHPLQTQAVTYIVQRMTSMAALFYLAAVLFYMNTRLMTAAGTTTGEGHNSSRRRTRPDRRHNRLRNTVVLFVLASLSGGAAVLCKQNAATLPAVIVMLEYLLFERTWQGWKKKLPWLVAGGVLWGLLLLATVGFFGTPDNGSTPGDIASLTRMAGQTVTRWNYLCTQFNAVSVYIRLLVLPVKQNLDYMYPFNDGFFDGLTPLAFLFLTAVLLFGLLAAKKQPVMSLAVLWFFITLAVESSVIPIDDALVEHRLYLPLFGFALLVPLLIYNRFRRRPAAAITCCCLVVVLLGAATFARNLVWRDPSTLWMDVIDKSPGNSRAYNNLGWVMARQERYEEAIELFQKALEIRPGYAEALNNMGFAYKELDHLDEAVQACSRALELKPNFVKAHVCLAHIYMKQNKFEEAGHHYRLGLRVQPYNLDAHNNLGLALVNLGKIDEGISCYQAALELEPGDAEVLTNLGLALKKKGKTDQAEEHFTMALNSDSQCAEAHHHLGTVLAGRGDLQQAMDRYHEALRLKPEYADAHNNMGLALGQLGNHQEAAEFFSRAVSHQPDLAEAHNNLGGTLARMGKANEAVSHIEKAIQLKPGFASAHNNMGNAMFILNRYHDAVFHYSEALKFDPQLEAARTNLAIVRKKLITSGDPGIESE